jgi:serine phosphatase RsbU (regulator of sigma subunit)
MKNLVRTITYAGIDYAENSHDRKSILIINRMSIILAIMMFTFVMFGLISHTYHLLFFTIPFLIAFCAAPIFNAQGWLTFSKWFFAFLPVACLMVVCIYNGAELGDKFFFLTTGAIPILLFRKTWTVYLVFYMSVVCFVFATWYQNNHQPIIKLSDNISTQYYYFTMLSVFAVLFYVIRYFKGDADAHERAIEEQKELITEKNKEILDSINYAKRIQYTLLAHEELLKQNLPEHFVLFKPKDIVSGDFYWATAVNSRQSQSAVDSAELPAATANSKLFYLAVCDSTGHGVPGAFMSLLNCSFLNEAITEKNISKPNEVLDHVRKRLIESISQDGGKDGMDGILVCFERNSNGTNKVTYAAANNNPILIRNGEIKELPADKMPVGLGEKKDPFALNTIELQKGDTLYLYTDGYADQFGGPKGKKFKYKTLNELLIRINQKPCLEQKQVLNTHFENWKGSLEQVDDVCIVGIHI